MPTSPGAVPYFLPGCRTYRLWPVETFWHAGPSETRVRCLSISSVLETSSTSLCDSVRSALLMLVVHLMKGLAVLEQPRQSATGGMEAHPRFRGLVQKMKAAHLNFRDQSMYGEVFIQQALSAMRCIERSFACRTSPLPPKSPPISMPTISS